MKLRYESKPNAPAWEWDAAVYEHEGKEYRIQKKKIDALLKAERETHAISEISHWPDELLNQVLFWVKMLHNPD